MAMDASQVIRNQYPLLIRQLFHLQIRSRLVRLALALVLVLVLGPRCRRRRRR